MTNPDWKHFQAWCSRHGQRPLPPDPSILVFYIRSMLESGATRETVTRRMEGVGRAFRQQGQKDPTGARRVLQELAAHPEAPSGHQELQGTPASESRSSPPDDILPAVARGHANLPPELAASSRSLPQTLLGHSTPAIEHQVRSFLSSVEAMFEAWLGRRENKNTQRAYRADVMDFVSFLGLKWPDEAERLLTATVPDVQAWRDFLRDEKHAAPKTLNRKVSSVSGFYKFMREAAAEARLPILVPNPAHAQFLARETQDPVDPTHALSTSRAQHLMALPKGDDVLAARDRAILKFYLYSGARIGTGCRLRVEDLHIEEDDATIKVHEKGRGRSKRAIGLHFAAAEAIRDYVHKAGIASGPLFRARANSRAKEKLSDRAMDEATMYRLLMHYLARLPKATREVELPDGEKVSECIYTPHSLRATTATLLLDAGVEITEVQQLLGHKHVTVTQVYDKRRRSTRESASHKVPL